VRSIILFSARIAPQHTIRSRNVSSGFGGLRISPTLFAVSPDRQTLNSMPFCMGGHMPCIAESHMPHKEHQTQRKTGKQSQDALRHQLDAQHNKLHKTPLPGVIDPIETDSTIAPEVPKVGSRDAPGG
jgi:hypothetical protein